MVPCSRLIIIIIFMINIIMSDQASAKSSFLYEYCDNVKGNYTARNSTSTTPTYKANLNRVLSILPSTGGNGNGFYISSYGQNPNKVYATGLCRGDVEARVCTSCLNQSTHLLTQVCPNQKEAIGGFDDCMLRYSKDSSLHLLETSPRFYLWNSQNVSSSTNYTDRFVQDLMTLLNNLKNLAAAGGNLRKYATGNKTRLLAPDDDHGHEEFETIYALVQCTPDLSGIDCNNCLDEAFGDMVSRFYGKLGGRVITPSCNFRYEVYLFYGHSSYESPPAQTVLPVSPSPLPLTNGTTTAAQGKKSNSTSGSAVVVVPTAASVLIIISVGVYSRVRKTVKNDINQSDDQAHPSSYEDAKQIGCTECLRFSRSTIRAATNMFSEENKIGPTSLGQVYKGRLHDNGQEIAVKSFDGDDWNRDIFKKEVVLGSKLQHRNLVRFLGFCLEGSGRFLVYEFVPTSLDCLLFDTHKAKHLDWDGRCKIIKGTACGLLYLHEDYHSTIIHCNIKASNILLDEQMNPKISGFEMAKLLGVDQSEEESRLNILGGRRSLLEFTAPEFEHHGRIPVKIDVFSFGVLILEIVSGRRNIFFSHGNNEPDQCLVSTAWENWREETPLNLVDPQIRAGSALNLVDTLGAPEESEMMRYIHIGLLCVQANETLRPTMRSVVHMLSCYSLSLPIPSPPPYVNDDHDHSNTINIHQSSAAARSSSSSPSDLNSSDDHYSTREFVVRPSDMSSPSSSSEKNLDVHDQL